MHNSRLTKLRITKFRSYELPALPELAGNLPNKISSLESFKPRYNVKERIFYWCLRDIIPFRTYSMCCNVIRFHCYVFSVHKLVDLYIVLVHLLLF